MEDCLRILKCFLDYVYEGFLQGCCLHRIFLGTVETYDKKLCFGALESGFFLFPAGYIYSFGRGIRFSGQKCSIPASGGQQIGKTKPENFKNLRVSISYPMISYHMSPP